MAKIKSRETTPASHPATEGKPVLSSPRNAASSARSNPKSSYFGSRLNLAKPSRAHHKDLLEVSQRLSDRIIQATPNLVYIYDLVEGLSVFVNPQASQILGYAKKEVEKMGIKLLLRNLHPDDVQVVVEHLARLADAQDEDVFEIEYRVQRADGQWRWLQSRDVVFSRGQDGRPKEILGMAVDTTRRKTAEEELRHLSARIVSAQEDERRRLARELHDDLCQKLAALSIDLELLQQSLPTSRKEILKRLQPIGERLGLLSDTVRDLSHQLHPAVLDDLGLKAALQTECEEFAVREGIPVRFLSGKLPSSISPEVAMCLYRVAQQSLWNVARHSRASRVMVRLRRTDDRLVLTIQDTGVGFDPLNVSGQTGLGLASMEERVRLVRGRFSVRSEPGQGTEVRAEVPLGKRHARTKKSFP
ncbi:MAG: PAS domain-containing protein [Acidobacteriota bacterium]